MTNHRTSCPMNRGMLWVGIWGQGRFPGGLGGLLPRGVRCGPARGRATENGVSTRQPSVAASRRPHIWPLGGRSCLDSRPEGRVLSCRPRGGWAPRPLRLAAESSSPQPWDGGSRSSLPSASDGSHVLGPPTPLRSWPLQSQPRQVESSRALHVSDAPSCLSSPASSVLGPRVVSGLYPSSPG